MWLGIVIGLLLGAAFESFHAAMVMAIIGAAAGAILAGRKKPVPDEAGLNELRTQINSMFVQIRQTNQRLAALEKQVAEGRLTPPAAAEPVVGGTAVPVVAAEGSSEAVSPVAVSDEELERQAMATLVEATRMAAEAPVSSVTSAVSPTLSDELMAKPASDTAQKIAPENVPEIVAPELCGHEFSAHPPRPQPESMRRPARRMVKATPVEPTWFSEFVKRWVVGGNPIVKVGVLILFLGLAFLLRYVAENTVVPVELRYAGVALAGVGLLIAGWRWREKKDNYGVILQGAGIGVLYLTTLAGMKLHPLIPPELGFVVLIGVAAFAALLAVLENALPLAVAASLGGFAAPVLASTGSEHHLAFFSYLTVLNLGIAAIAWFKAWRILNLLGFVCTTFLAGSWAETYYQPSLFGLAEPFLLLFFVLYVLIAFLFARRTLGDAEKEGETGFEAHVRQALPHVTYVDGSLVFGVPMATFAMQYLMTRSFENGPAFSALGFGLLYIVLAFALFRRTGLRYALLSETMIALAVIFGSLALPLGLEGEWTCAGWAVEAAGVYWVGVRQQRVHARMFALLLLFGSSVYFALGLHVGLGESVLDGSLLGSLMLALSLGWTYRLLRRTPDAELHAFEPGLRPWLAGSASFFVDLMPFLMWSMNWAATVLTLLGAAMMFMARRLPERALITLGSLAQLAGGGLFLTTLHRAYDGSVLGGGWHGLLTAGVIGGAMLLGAVLALRTARENPVVNAENGTNFSLQSPVLLAGLAFINLAPLFVLPWRLAAMVWPLTGIATLWWALQSGQRLALAFALALQALAGLVVLYGHAAFVWVAAPEEAPAAAFMHAGFWSPLLIALAALVGARLLQREARKGEEATGWGALCWSTGWWALAWSDELHRLLPPVSGVAALLAVVLLTAAGWQWLARRLKWTQIGQSTLLYLPVLAVLLTEEMAAGAERPLLGFGLLLWPLALVMHVRLLRAQEDWLNPTLRQAAHVFGAWLFIALAALEVQHHIAGFGGAGRAWAWFGWLPVPLLFVWLLNNDRLAGRWPLTAYCDAYAVVAMPPLALLLLAWGWLGNALGDGAAPLPYVPLLNPLELGQVAILLGIARWWAGLRERPAFRGSTPVLIGVLGLTAFAELSSLVLRTCHQWGGVPWHSGAMLQSMLAQASLSIVWSLLAIGLMLFAHRRALRLLWLIGAGLVGLVVLKLFLIELAASGSLARIVSFIVVGLLLLLVGYFAPLPPRRESTDAAENPAVQS